MKSKTSRKLRRYANGVTVGQPKVKYDVGYLPKFSPVGFDGKLINDDPFGPVQQIVSWKKTAPGKPTKLNKGCTRYVYKRLKIKHNEFSRRHHGSNSNNAKRVDR